MKNLNILIAGVYPNTLGDLSFCLEDWIFIVEGYRSTSGRMLTLQFRVKRGALSSFVDP